MDTLQQNLLSKEINAVYFSTMGNSTAEAFYTQCGFSRSSKQIMMAKKISVIHPQEEN